MVEFVLPILQSVLLGFELLLGDLTLQPQIHQPVEFVLYLGVLLLQLPDFLIMKRLFSAVGFLDVIHDILKHLRILDPEVIENIGNLFQHAVFSDPHDFLSIVRLPTAQICPLGGFPVLIDSFLGIGGDHLARGSTGQ